MKRTHANQFLACCPAHDDKNPSLAIKDMSDRLLIKCMAGCGIEDIMEAANLTWDDIMPEKQPTENYKPAPIKIYATDILKSIRFEAQIVTLAAIELKNGKPLGKIDHDRLLVAMERINTGILSL